MDMHGQHKNVFKTYVDDSAYVVMSAHPTLCGNNTSKREPAAYALSWCWWFVLVADAGHRGLFLNARKNKTSGGKQLFLRCIYLR